jgi:hypothetical protein
VLLVLALVPAARAQGPQGTGFTYQGRLTADAAPVSGAYDFRFVLFDAPTAGGQVGPTVTIDDVAVAEGLFTVTLDFGNVFGTARRWLELAVRPGASTGPYAAILPRQELTPGPSSLFSAEAADAQRLGGVSASLFVQTSDPRLSDARDPLPGSPDYVQNGTTPQPGVSFNVGGTGTADVVNAATRYDLAGAPILRSPGTGTLLVGAEAGAASIGNFNSFVGFRAGALNEGGTFNTFVGAEAGAANVVGTQSTYVGRNAGRNSTGGQNTFIGRNAGNSNVEGSFNTILGYFADVGSPNLTNATAIGSGARVNTSDTMVLGNSAVTVQVPGSQVVTGTLTVAGSFQASTLDAATQYNLGGQRVLVKASRDLYVGTGAGTAGSGVANTFVGTDAGHVNFGINNTFVGTDAGRNSTGHNNTFVGSEAGRDMVTGQSNAFFGSAAGRTNTGSFNAFAGAGAGAFSTTGGSNAFFGASAGVFNTTGAQNVFVGESAGGNNSTGSDNTFVGRDADWAGAIPAGDGNTLLGASTRISFNMSGATAIGARAEVARGDSMVLGAIQGVNGAAASTNVGIGTTAPNARLHLVDGAGLLFGASSGCAGFVGLAFGSAIDTGCRSYALFGGDGNTYINRPAGNGSIVFRSGNVTQMSITPFGVLNVPFLSGSGTTALCRNASNDLATCSSSLRYKGDVESLQGGLEIVERLRPIRFTWKSTGQPDIGLAAEEVAQVDPLLAFRNAEGEIEGVNYSQLTAVLVKALQQQQAQIDALKAIVCRNDPQAGPCVAR